MGGHAERVSGGDLRSMLARVYRLGYRSSLILLGIGVFLPLAGLEAFRVAAHAGLGVLLVTPMASALAVGGKGVVRRDRGLVLVVAGIFLLLVAAALLQLS
ncbi:MAG: hypothetical protein R6W82_03375 [bacterium]